MTKKDYVLIADTIQRFLRADLSNEFGFSANDRASYNMLSNNLVNRFANSLKETNPLFDLIKFREACGLKAV